MRGRTTRLAGGDPHQLHAWPRQSRRRPALIHLHLIRTELDLCVQLQPKHLLHFFASPADVNFALTAGLSGEPQVNQLHNDTLLGSLTM